jgi:hypothetical protein
VIILALYFFQHFKVPSLVLHRVIFNVPKFSLCFHRRKIELRKLLLFDLNASANIRAMLESLTYERFNYARDFDIWKYEGASFEGSLKGRNQNNIGIQIF